MRNIFAGGRRQWRGIARACAASAGLALAGAAAANAQTAGESTGGEASLKLPDLRQVIFLGRVDGHTLLLVGIVFCVLGLAFGLGIYSKLKRLPVHRAMREMSELIYETCKTYLITQGKFLLLLWTFIAAVIVLYFGVLPPCIDAVARADHSGLQRGGHRGKLRRGVVRHSREHLREFADGLCGAAGANRIRSTRFR